ncbi:MAG: caspase family protein [Nitratireductor sp.]|nr:caspase family protein [Nitratireductor sp.]
MRLTGLFLFVLCVGMAVAAVSSRAAERVALIIGNGEYAHASALANPANDARAVADKLRTLGFGVTDGYDLTDREMTQVVRDFLREAEGAKLALVYYAGHGLQVDGRNYLVPVDAKLENSTDLSFETISLDTILDLLNDPNRANIIMLDACRNNPLARSLKTRSTRSVAVGQGLAPYSTVGTGTLIAFATAPEQVALDGDDGHSPFTRALLKHLDTPGLEVRQMLSRVRSDVTQATGNEQVPWDNSSLLGDVYLAGPALATASNAAGSGPAAAGGDILAEQRRLLAETEALRKATAEELEKARLSAKELADARKAADAGLETTRQAALIRPENPAAKPDGRKQDRFAAVAVSMPDHKYYGTGYNFGTLDEAQKRAVKECGRKGCKVVQWVKNGCLALAMGSTGGYGHDWAPKIAKAEASAVRFCEEYDKNCKVAFSICTKSD